MKRIMKLAIILPLWAASLFAQTRAETMDYLIREFKSFESERYLVKDISFSEGGMVFSYTTYVPGNTDERLAFSLDNVNVFMAQKMAPKGDFQYDLMVETRGKSGKMQINGADVSGSIPILKNISNRNRIQTMEKAFTHLKKLVGTEDSKTPF